MQAKRIGEYDFYTLRLHEAGEPSETKEATQVWAHVLPESWNDKWQKWLRLS